MTRTARIEAAGTVLGGAALAFAQPGFGAWPLAWIGIAPLLLAVRGSSPRRAFWLGWLAGIVYYGIVLYWIAPTIATYTRITMPVAIVLELMSWRQWPVSSSVRSRPSSSGSRLRASAA